MKIAVIFVSDLFMKSLKFIIRSTLLATITVAISQCANPVMPTGGPKDKEPPVPVGSEPPNYAKSFTDDKISIEFNEFIQLEDPGNNILISPPVNKDPEFILRGKNLIAKFEEPLKDQTTYTIFFGNSIVDLNEKNPLPNYQFVFSTGESIDSLSIKGYALNAFNLKPQDKMYVMLYTLDNDTVPADSMPLLVKPYYISQTDENGFFELNNIRNLEYKIFALKDINNNMIYDLPNEEIAFLDTLLSPEYFTPPEPDTTAADTTEMEESQMEDSLMVEYPDNTVYDLFVFDEIDSTQGLLDAKLLAEQKILFAFKFPTEDIQIVMLNDDVKNDNSWKINDLNKTGDTLVYWLKEIPADTLKVIIADDTLILDTTQIVIRKEEKKNKKEEEKTSDYLKINTNIKGNKAELNKPLYLNFPYPVIHYNLDEVFLIEDEDTLQANPYYTDTVHRKLAINKVWLEDTPYGLFFKDSLFTDIRGLSNDTVQLSFRSKSLGDYGIMKINFTPDSLCRQYVIQLMDKNEEVLQERIVRSAEQIVYEYLKPGEFIIKAICDSNKNGKWDTGDYLKKIQPERVYYFPKTIEVRSNWEIEEEWDLSVTDR